MAQFDMHLVMEQLAARRPIFRSEPDFQFAMKEQVEKMTPGCEVLLEHKPFPSEDMRLDIWLPAEGVAIELKYPTRDLHTEFGGEQFTLTNQGADDQRRYDYIKDVQRLERIVADLESASAGFAVMLTNEPLYWKPRQGGGISDAFFLYEGRRLTGQMAWAEHAGKGSIQGREAPLLLSEAYDLHWMDYSVLPDKYGQFRYLAVEVG